MSSVNPHAKKLKAAAAAYAKAREARDEAIREAARDGISRRQIAQQVGLSFGRVQQIVSAGKAEP